MSIRLSLTRTIISASLFSCLVACDEQAKKPKGVAPPPIQSSKSGVCDSGGGKVADALAAGFFPRVAGDYCVDPNGDVRSYGAEAKGDLDKLCTDQLDGECEVYKGYGVDRMVIVPYVDGKGSPGTVSVKLARYQTPEGAYGFFTRRVVGDDDPAQRPPRPLKAGGSATLGSTIAYVWRGRYVAELSYANELQPPAKLKAAGDKILPAIAVPLGDKLPGDKTAPAAARKLPAKEQLKMGVRYEVKSLLGVDGTGKGAVGYYKRGEQRYRILSIIRPDEASAQDVIGTFKKRPGASSTKGVPVQAIVVPIKISDAGPTAEWVFGHVGGQVFGVGDEDHSLDGAKPAAESAKFRLSKDDKLALLKTLLEAEQKPAAAP